MNENLNLVEILKDCPKGTKLYSPLFGEVEFEQILENWGYVSVRKGKDTWPFESDARFPISDSKSAELMLYPSKEQRDWSKFTAPWLKNERDVLSNSSNTGKNEQKSDDKVEPKFKVGDWLCANELNDYANNIKIVNIVDVFGKKRYKISRDYDSDLDLVEFNFIEEHYHLWTIQDAKDGDVLVNGSNIFIFYFINNRRLMGYCHVNMDDGNFYNDIGRNECFCTIDAPVTPATKEQRDALMKAMNNAGYEWDEKKNELRELIKPKFDPKTLQPFDKVLGRDDDFEKWNCAFFSHKDTSGAYHCRCTGMPYVYCIPYNDDTKHLVGTAEEAPEFYRYWEE